jgi:glycosyltransferase involved in cell wall biosynthesis
LSGAEKEIRRSIVVSVPASYDAWADAAHATLGPNSRVIRRQSDWGLSGVRKLAWNLREIARASLAARRADALVVCTAGAALLAVAGVLARLKLGPRVLVALDLLVSERQPGWLESHMGLRRVNRWICIRSGDMPVLESSYGAPARSISFVPFVAVPGLLDRVVTEGDYVYSGGWAQRDWTTLFAGLEKAAVKAVVSAPMRIAAPSGGQVEVLTQLSPQAGRATMAGALAVVVCLLETDTASGPLFLLDAMALGKAVVATNVKGCRDYVTDGVDGLLVPPCDPGALASAVGRVAGDPALRERLGSAARARAVGLSPEAFFARIGEEVGKATL